MAIKKSKLFSNRAGLSSIFVIFLLAGFLVLGLPVKVGAYDILPGLTDLGESTFSFALEDGNLLTVACPEVGTGLGTSIDTAALIKCMEIAANKNNKTIKAETLKSIKALEKKQAREEWWAATQDKLRESLAVMFKQSLSTFSRQVAHDTAVWVASGGRGQQPLFITEGWGPYLQNAADVALGQFIDGVGTSFGVDLCQPDFSVRLAVKTGINYNRPLKTRCSFSRISQNWQSAIANPNFAFEYQQAMRPGENDISFYMIMADRSVSYVAGQVKTAEKEAETNSLFKDIKNIAGNILTPGTFIADQLRESQKDADIGLATFTNTAADIIEEFLNTLVAQLLRNLQAGFFAGSGSGVGGGTGFGNNLDLSSLADLFNLNTSPLGGGAAGAKEKFSSLILNKEKIGNRFDILVKLAKCDESAKNNPGPTDCVIDSELAAKIKEQIYVKNLPGNIAGRVFAPIINQTNSLETEIPYRSILILRKYRIVPVGWEIAANLIREGKVNDSPGCAGGENSNPLTNNWTLADLMNCFDGKDINGCQTDCFKGLVDPYWSLKAYEAYCRRQGYGAQNVQKDSQDSSISRVEYCADEQQCLSQDSKGNCQAYGYCTEERRLWDIGEPCEAKYNTCQSYKSRAGAQTNWLTNTLDFSTCNSDNAGCRSYATNFNYASKEWNGDVIEDNGVKEFSAVSSDTKVTVPSDPGNGSYWFVLDGSYVSVNNRLRLSLPCNQANCTGPMAEICTWNDRDKHCSFMNKECTIATGGISCYISKCYDSTNLLAIKNYNFEIAESEQSFNASDWTEAYVDDNNRHYRSTGGQSGFGLRLVSAKNSAQLNSYLPNVTVEANKTYRLRFTAKGIINSGAVKVAVYKTSAITNGSLNSDNFIASSASLTETLPNTYWTTYEVEFNSGAGTNIDLVISTLADTVSSNVVLDNFQLIKFSDSCQGFNAKVYNDLSNQNVAPNKFFDRDAQTCSGNDEGCSQFIRTKAGLANNLLPNGGFEDGVLGWQMNSAQPIVFNGENRSAQFGFDNPGNAYANYRAVEIEPGKFYVVAYDAAKLSTTDTNGAELKLFFTDSLADRGVLADHLNITSSGLLTETNCTIVDNKTILLPNKPIGVNFNRTSCYFRAPDNASHLFLHISSAAANTTTTIDNVKLEKVGWPNLDGTAYSPYNPATLLSNQVTYLKKAPDYFNCYQTAAGVWPENSLQLQSVLANRKSECSSFAGVCTKDEVGCNAYTPANGDPDIFGVVTDYDLCPAECVGYQVYKQEKTNFTKSDSYRQFIANKQVKYCTAAASGCDEFTNLDMVGQGAEKKEYYSRFRVCQKPSLDDASYYTWEGSDTTGFQLKAFNLKKSNLSSAPCTNLSYNGVGQPICEDPTPDELSSYTDLAKLEAGICEQAGMLVNSDCREFYDINGNIYYRLLSKTVAVSNDCHPYRRTPTQLTADQIEIDCKGTGGYYNANGECIYMAIPGESKTCSASVKGCRTYKGNQGNNVRNVIEASDFNSGTTADILWVDSNGTKNGIFVSSVSTYPGGNSLSNQNSNKVIKHPVSLFKNRSYTLSFWAQGNISFTFDRIGFQKPNGDNIGEQFANVSVSDSDLTSEFAVAGQTWKYYELGPVFYTGDTGAQYLAFVLPDNATVYLDNIILKESVSNIYAVENSWYTPISCDNKLDDATGTKAISADEKNGTNFCQDSASGRCSVGEQLGCSAYSDPQRNTWNLKSFDSLCREDAVGCEALIDTFNSDYPESRSYNTEEEAGGTIFDSVVIPQDKLVYLVNNDKFSCQNSAKGCRALGLPAVDANDRIYDYKTVFLKDDPNRYATDLCKYNEEWCEEYSTGNSLKYFKDPHGKTCEYKLGSQGYNWYKINSNTLCQTTTTQTFGTGYEPATNKLQPLGPNNPLTETSNGGYDNWVGECPEKQSTCSEFIDPLTFTYTQEVSPSNCSFYPDGGNPNIGDGVCRNVKLKANTLYSYSLSSVSRLTVNSFGSGCTVINNPLSGNFFYLSAPVGQNYCTVTLAKSGQAWDFARDIRENGDKITIAGVYYALANTINEGSCNGQADYGNGCLLFNNRGQIDYNQNDLSKRYNNYLVYNVLDTFKANLLLDNDGKQQAVTPKSSASNDASIILKADPDRTCRSWLSCLTYEKASSNESTNPYFSTGDRCLSVAQCDYLDQNGQCGNYPAVSSDVAISASSTNNGLYVNLTGYTGDKTYNYGAMKQSGESAVVINGNFETTVGDTAQPVGWLKATLVCETAANCTNNYPYFSTIGSWQPDLYSAFKDRKNTYEGVRFLKLNSRSAIMSETIDIDTAGGNTYNLTAYANTKNLTGEISGNLYPRTELRLKFFNSNNEPVDLSGLQITDASGKIINGIYFNNWLSLDSLKLNSGSDDWEQLSANLEFPTNSSVSSIQIALVNVNPITDDPNVDNSKLGGYSAWDDISIKPVLLAGTSNQVQRSCRIYPGQDAVSCNYHDGTNQYYGQYGYCLLSDPANKQQCLQWWPVDAIKGEAVSDFTSYYSERFPLYYCLEKSVVAMDLNRANGQLGAFGGGMESSLSSLALSNELKNEAFGVSANWAPLFRYPFVYKFSFVGVMAGVGSTASHVFGFGVFNAVMYPKLVCAGTGNLFQGLLGKTFGGIVEMPGCYKIWGSGTKASISSNDGENEGENSYICEKNTDISCSPTLATCTDEGLFDPNGGQYWYDNICNTAIENTRDGVCGDFANGKTLACVKKEDDSSFFGKLWSVLTSWISGAVDSFKGIVGNIIETITGLELDNSLRLTNADIWGGWGMVATLLSSNSSFGVVVGIPLPWHTVINFRNSTLGNILSGLANRNIFVMTQGMKIVTDEDGELAKGYTDPDPNHKGDILGYSHFWDIGSSQGFGDKTGGMIITGKVEAKTKLEYCTKLVQVVNSAGVSKAWSARLSSNSGYRTSDMDCILDAESTSSSAGINLAVGQRCFYASSYCTHRSNWDVLQDRYVALCDFGDVVSFIGNSGEAVDPDRNNNDIKLYCSDKKLDNSNLKSDGSVKSCDDISGDQGDLFRVVSQTNNNQDCQIKYDYFCKDDRIFRKIYSTNLYGYLTADYKPYGSIVAPSNGQYPNEWDTRPETMGKQPLFYELPFGKQAPGQARMGQVHSETELKKLFAKTYSVWEWSGDMTKDLDSFGLYEPSNELGWGLPGYCNVGADANFCKNRPKFIEVKLDQPNMYNISATAPVSLKFTVDVDPNQLPITGYSVDWQDGEKTSYSGVALTNRPSTSSPLTLYHYYDFNKVKQFCSSNPSACGIVEECGTVPSSFNSGKYLACNESCCVLKPQISVTDNWQAKNSSSLTGNKQVIWINKE